MTPTKLWHASRADIARPTLSGRTVGDHHDNSGLGLFCATAPDDYIANFGPYIFELDLVDDLRVKRLTIGEFAALSRSAGTTRAEFEALGLRWSDQYDCLAIEEVDGQVRQAVILSDRAIANATRHDVQGFLEFHARRPGPRLNRP